MPMFQIECGKHRDTVIANTVGIAWRKLTKNQTDGFAELARFRRAYPASKNRTWRSGWGVWYYITPQALDRAR